MTITDIDKQLIDNFLADLADNEWIIDDPYSPDMVEMPLFQLEQKLKNLVTQAKAEVVNEIANDIGLTGVDKVIFVDRYSGESNIKGLQSVLGGK